jgi:hypothetical protein
MIMISASFPTTKQEYLYYNQQVQRTNVSMEHSVFKVYSITAS